MDANDGPAKKSADHKDDEPLGPTAPEDYAKAAWRLRNDLSQRIPDIRTDAFAIDGYYAEPWQKKRKTKDEEPWPPPDLSSIYLGPRPPEPRLVGEDPRAKIDWAHRTVAWADELGDDLRNASMKVDYTNHDWVIRFIMVTTHAAGLLLRATEELLFELPSGTQANSPTPAPNPDAPAVQLAAKPKGPPPSASSSTDPPALEAELSLAAYTCVMAARNHVVAAEQADQNLRQRISNREILCLVGILAGSVFAYGFFNPVWGLWKFPLKNPIWEVVWWSLFGAIAASYLWVNKDMETDVFDSRHPYKYVYRIVTAPLVAVVIIFLWTVVGVSLSSSTAASALTLSTGTLPNLATLVVLSFLLGFFSKEALNILKNAWKGVTSTGSSSKQEGTS